MKRQFYLKQQTFIKNNLTMPGTATVVWYRSRVKAPGPGLTWVDQVLGCNRQEAEPVLGFFSQAGMKCFFSSCLFFLYFQLNPCQQEPPSA